MMAGGVPSPCVLHCWITAKPEMHAQPLQVLTALELSRQARMAANRAYLAGLGLGPRAMHEGAVSALQPDDPLVLAAAREMARTAAAAQAKKQVRHAQSREVDMLRFKMISSNDQLSRFWHRSLRRRAFHIRCESVLQGATIGPCVGK
jgi:hypothetical protein